MRLKTVFNQPISLNENGVELRMFSVLDFSPTEHTFNYFKELASKVEHIVPVDFIDYFEDNYVGRPNRNGVRRKPKFPVNMWNVYLRTVENLPRTNNALEGFHRGFESMLQAAKPDVWKFLEAIHRQQALQEFNVSQQRLGKNIVKPNENFARIKRIVCSCADYNPFEYLEAIASNTVF